MKQCPVELKTYEINKYKVALSELPPIVLDGDLSLSFKINTKNEDIYTYTVFVSIIPS